MATTAKFRGNTPGALPDYITCYYCGEPRHTKIYCTKPGLYQHWLRNQPGGEGGQVSAVMANAMERSIPFTPIPKQLPSAPVLLQLPAPVTPTINVIEETAAAITQSQGKQPEPEILEEKSLKEKEPLKPLNKEQWKEEEELTKKMVDVVRLSQKDEQLPGPRQWDEQIFREGTTTKRPRYQLTSNWEGLPSNPTQPLYMIVQ